MPAKATGNSTERAAAPSEEWIGGYRVLGKAGSGGMATVWRVKDERGRDRALKEMRPQREAQREMARRFKQEFEVTAKLDHRNIVKVHDFFEAHDTFHIVMEWIDGLDLRGMLHYGGLLDDGRLAHIGGDIASGLAHAHTRGVLHRDMKPENILLDRRGKVRVTDFGVARVQGTRLTATGIIVGSPAYMSPEQLAGVSGQKLTAASDVYALGVMLYEMIEGRDPLGLKKHEDLLTVLRAKRDKTPRSMRRVQDPELEALILQCLDPLEEERPQSMDDVARRLRRVARRHGTNRLDIEHLALHALAQQEEKVRARGQEAPQRPLEEEEPEPQPAPRRGWGGRGPRQPRVPERTSSVASGPPLAPSVAPPGRPAADRSLADRPMHRRSLADRPFADRPAAPRPPSPPRAPRSRDPNVEPWDGADPTWSGVEDYGSGSRHASRVADLSVKRRSVYEDGTRLLARLAIAMLVVLVIVFAASASLTGSPLGLVEMLVPMP